MNDRYMKDIFRSQKKEIPDEGFSRRIATHLPRRNNIMPQVIVAIFSLVGACAVVMITGTGPIIELVNSISPAKISLDGAVIATYCSIIAAITTIGLSINKAAG